MELLCKIEKIVVVNTIDNREKKSLNKMAQNTHTYIQKKEQNRAQVDITESRNR